MLILEQVKPTEPAILAMVANHYSHLSNIRERPRTQKTVKTWWSNARLFVLSDPDRTLVFAWQWPKDGIRKDGQNGFNNTLFHRSDRCPYLASDIIRLAEQKAIEHWGVNRFYTYVDAEKVGQNNSFHNPGYCYKKAGWQFIRMSGSGKHLLSKEIEGEAMYKKTKKSKGMKSNLETQRELRKKNVEQAEKAAKGKKQPKPAKPAKQPKEKPAKVEKDKKKDAAKQDDFLQGGVITELKAKANQLLPEIEEGIKTFSSAYDVAVSTDKKLQEWREQELWRYCEAKHEDGTIGPFKSWTACVGHFKNIAGKSSATLFGMIGLQKALPGSTAEERRAIGPRKGAKVAAAAKVAKKKGKDLPPEIIEAAKTQTEPELTKTIEAAGLVEDEPIISDNSKQGTLIDEIPDGLLADTSKNTMPFNPRTGGSKIVEGESDTAQQFSGVVQEAIDVAITVYDSPEEPFTQSDALKFVCKQWLLTPCEREGYTDTTNRAAADEIRAAAKKNGKKSKATA